MKGVGGSLGLRYWFILFEIKRFSSSSIIACNKKYDIYDDIIEQVTVLHQFTQHTKEPFRVK